MNELLQGEALQGATLTEALEQLKHAGKELWKLASAKPIVGIARSISGVDRLEQRLKSKRRPRRASLSPAELDALNTRILEFLKSAKEPQTVGQISKALSLDQVVLKSVLLKLRAAKQITAQGKQRSTRYLLP